MAVVPAGSFDLGCGSDPACAAAGDTPQSVNFAAPFALSMHEVTFDEFDRFATATERTRPDDAGWGRGRRPVINVSWHDASAYAGWLSEQTGRDYRLPTEAEWEYAARGDTATAYHWGDVAGSGQANCGDCGGRAAGRTLPAGSFAANAWGLHDMHGNVWEWVQDCWNARPAVSPPDNATTTREDCDRRVLRGGSWLNSAEYARSTSRLSGNADVRGTIAGFRVATRDLSGVGVERP
ncbi:MAG: SUMF1/EgtB/PvdO family nonheme iron enzyme [Gammaproteobacteria bacterium]|nr:SUMF1/EgtB/PvdO family nonheme iron enzyme [Gammaproteobacteria bacterium]